MSEKEQIESQDSAEAAPQAQQADLSPSELESVSGGSGIVLAAIGPVVISSLPTSI